MADPEYLSMRRARERVGRSRRTIQRWKRQGMPYITINGRDFIALTDLLTTFRQKLISNPARKKVRDDA